MTEIIEAGLSQNLRWFLVGNGNLGKSLVSAWMQRGLCNSDCMIVDSKSPPQEGFPGSYIQSLDFLSSTVDPDIIILAVKPNQINNILEKSLVFISKKTIWLSVMAGVKVEMLKTIIGSESKVIRVMPNLASGVMKGITGIWYDKTIKSEDIRKVTKLLSALGRCVWLNDEDKVNSITALTGSGPAYVYAFIEALVSAGKEIGCDEFNESVAIDLIMGSVYLLLSQKKDDATSLRMSVTSPGGTTEAAMTILQNTKGKCDLNVLLTEAIKKGKNKADELALTVNEQLNRKQ